MASIVLDLQKEILSPNCDIVNVLRKAHLIAVKLKLSDFYKKSVWCGPIVNDNYFVVRNVNESN